MAHVLGKIEYGNGLPERFFIHCDTSGQSYDPLFKSPEDAWEFFDHGGSVDVEDPKTSTDIFVVKKELASGRYFDSEDPINEGPVYCLASNDRLLWPKIRGDYDDDLWSILSSDGLLHVAVEVDTGFATQNKPICVDTWESRADELRIGMEDLFGQPLSVCPSCARKLFK